MALTPGSRLGVYEVTAPIGEGGMGQVWRATDTTLGRQVAIKILPDVFASDPERLARFEREAKTLASLNHPHIAAIYGFEKSSGTHALVMELVEGEDLSQRIARGAIPLDEALPIAKQIAEALEAAHERGIIHRDLKPANIKVRADGTVKVLDFGLAKAMDQGSGIGDQRSGGAANSPTITTPAMTQAGTILGTAAYMSPEQAKGRALDRRSDVWAFGAVLFEMLTGQRAFTGEDVTDTIVSVLSKEPDWSALAASTPASIRRLLRRCLEKDGKRRLDSAAAVRLEIDDVSSPAFAESGVWRPTGRALPWLAAFAVAGSVITVAIAWVALPGASPTPQDGVVRFAVHDSDRVVISRRDGDTALSPDGRTLAFIGYGEGGPLIWVRDLGSLEGRVLSGTEGAQDLCWSPDGRRIGFIANGQILVVAATGGSPDRLAIDDRGAEGMAWGRAGGILFTDSRGLWSIAGSGGAPSRVVARSADQIPASPSLLPDGQHFLLSVRSGDAAKAGTFVGTLGQGPLTRLFAFPATAQYAAGYLLFIRDLTLYAQPFDLRQLALRGDPVQLANNAASFSVSEAGAVVYVPTSTSEASGEGNLVWMNRAGEGLEPIKHTAGASRIRLSPDGHRLAMIRAQSLWVLDVTRDVLTRLTKGVANNPTWSADGQTLLFHRASARDGKDAIYQVAVGGVGEEMRVVSPDTAHAHPTDVSDDGRYLVYEGGNEGQDIWSLGLTPARPALPYLQTPSIETQGALSPDSRWLAYTSNSSGRFEVYVQSFPNPGPRIQVSPGGGAFPRWRDDGKELYYLTLDSTLTAVAVPAAGSLEFGKPAALFRFFSAIRGVVVQQAPYDVMPGGQRFVVNTVLRRSDPSLQVVLNWPAILARP